MLVLSRKSGEKVHIGNEITVTVVEVQGHRVKLGISAPDDQRILRGELAFWVDAPAPKEKSEKNTPRSGSEAALADLVLI